jgi:hypothetical protein
VNESHLLKFLPLRLLKGEIKVNEVRIKDYFQRHRKEFRVPVFIQTQYLILEPSEFEGKVMKRHPIRSQVKN